MAHLPFQTNLGRAWRSRHLIYVKPQSVACRKECQWLAHAAIFHVGIFAFYFHISGLEQASLMPFFADTGLQTGNCASCPSLFPAGAAISSW
jgi:hypothetical protein